MKSYFLWGMLFFLTVVIFGGIGKTASADDQGNPPVKAAAGIQPISNLNNSWFVIYKIRDHIFAIGEPRYYQHNISYLIAGQKRALLIDAGANATDEMLQVVKSLTDKPVSVLPTHLHFDHVGGLKYFDDIWLLDTPFVRSCKQSDGSYKIPGSFTLGFIDKFELPAIKVNRMVAPDEIIDLGRIKIKVVLAPGHSQDEAVIYDMTDNMLFAGDFIFPGVLIGGNSGQYLDSCTRVIDLINRDTEIYGAHAGENCSLVPKMYVSDIQALKQFLIEFAAGRSEGTLFNIPEFINRGMHHPINDRISYLDQVIWINGQEYKF